MHDSPVAPGALGGELLRVLGALSDPRDRAAAAEALARRLGGERLLFFSRDPELDVLLPAPGLPQVLPGAKTWRDFLRSCVEQGECSGSVPDAGGGTEPALGTALEDGTVAVLVGAGEEAPGPACLRPVLPLLGALFRAEREIAAKEARARSAGEAAERAQILTAALGQMRERLEKAVVEAEQARRSARERAEHAERLAAELQSTADQLQEQAVELETVNAELTARSEDAERARAAADEANRAKSDFLATMSHELRTPINAIVGYTELLSLGITGPVTPDQQAQLDRIRSSSQHLLSLVDDILDLTKVEAGRMSVMHEEEPVWRVVAETLEVMEAQAASSGITIENRCHAKGTEYVGDRDRVRQILANLLSNALKFTGPEGMVSVSCGSADCPDDALTAAGEAPWTWIAVEDTGIGIPADQLGRIFQPFVQADAGLTRSRGGTGLGLTISRQLARLMGGDLVARSEPGRGSRFVLWLPAVEPGAGSLEPSVRVSGSGRGALRPSGLAEVGERLQLRLIDIVEAAAERLRSLPEVQGLPGLGRREILEELPVLIAELAGLLIKLGRPEMSSTPLSGADRVQRVVAEEHGAARGRLGWSVEGLRREFAVIREEMLRALEEVSGSAPDTDAKGAKAVLGRLIRRAEQAAVLGLRAAAVAQDAGEAPPLPPGAPSESGSPPSRNA